MRKVCTSVTAVSILLLAALRAAAIEPAPADGLFNVSLTQLGATAKGSGSTFNTDWPPNNALVPGLGGGGTVFGGPLKGGGGWISACSCR